MEKSEIYVVKYSEGSYDDWREHTIFATTDEEKAFEYVNKFNRLLQKWKEYFKQFEYEKFKGVNSIKPEFEETKYDRWRQLREINQCYFRTVEIR